MSISKCELTKIIDSTNVRATATQYDIKKMCKEAVHYGFGCVCVNPVYVELAATLLKKSEVKVCSTVGFPCGTVLPDMKALEAVKAVEEEAQELDRVTNLSALKSESHQMVERGIRSVVDIKKLSEEIIVKVIIETDYLTRNEKIVACKLVKEAGADFVKTSTGFFGKGATVEDVRLMRETVGEEFGVKAAGGIRTYNDVVAMIEAGADRIGTSTAVAIVEGAP
jgi:deoxyribose-phosphate aldolase